MDRERRGPDIEGMIEEELDKARKEGWKEPKADQPLKPDDFKLSLKERIAIQRMKQEGRPRAEGPEAQLPKGKEAEPGPAPAPGGAEVTRERAPKDDLASAYEATKGLMQAASERHGDSRKAFEQIAAQQKEALKGRLVEASLNGLGELGADERSLLKQELLKQDFWTQMDTLMSGPQAAAKAVEKMKERITDRAKKIREAQSKRRGYRDAA